MNSPRPDDPTQPNGPEGGGPTPARRPTVLTWHGLTPPSLESVRLRVSEGRLRASGRMISAADPDAGVDAYSASFEAAIDRFKDGGRLLLRSTTAEDERQISLSRTDDGVWLIDHGKGAERNTFDGALFVDVAHSVTFNTLPIRRFGLHREPGEQEFPVVHVTLPALTITLVRQTYRTVSVDENGAVITFAQGDSSVDLVVDRDGLVLDHPGLSRRV